MSRRDRWSLALCALAVAGLGIALYSTRAPLDWRLGLLRLRTGEPLRPAILAVSSAVAAMIVSWRSSGWRRFSAVLAAGGAATVLALLARGSPETWPIADAAMTELYTVHASRGDLLLGAYSQYGWSHPGPMLFYWLVPFYVLGGRTIGALAAGALFLNVLSIWLCAAVAVRRSPGDPLLTVALVGLCAMLLYRSPGLVTSAWNPHIPVIPALTLLSVTAAVIAGAVHLLPIAVVYASFIAQAHIGLAPLAIAAIAGAGGAMALQYRDSVRRARIAGWTALSVVIAELLWLMPVSQQVAGRPGNMTQLFRFFLQGPGGDTPGAGAAFRIWGRALVGVLDPAFALPIGHAVPADGEMWSAIAATVLVLAMIPCGRLFRRRNRFLAVLAWVAAAAAVLAFWSVLHVRGAVGDYHVFWMAAIGIVAMSVCAAAAGTTVFSRRGSRSSTAALTYAGCLALTLVVLGNATRGLADRSEHEPIGDSERVRQLTAGLENRFPSRGVTRFLLRVDTDVWPVGSGVVLQLTKARAPFAVEDTVLYGDALGVRGGEEATVEICGIGRHRALMDAGASVPLVDAEGVFADLLLPLPASDR
jgi:hypothetical protein